MTTFLAFAGLSFLLLLSETDLVPLALPFLHTDLELLCSLEALFNVACLIENNTRPAPRHADAHYLAATGWRGTHAVHRSRLCSPLSQATPAYCPRPATRQHSGEASGLAPSPGSAPPTR